jgi:hypothetical protein
MTRCTPLILDFDGGAPRLGIVGAGFDSRRGIPWAHQSLPRTCPSMISLQVGSREIELLLKCETLGWR